MGARELRGEERLSAPERATVSWRNAPTLPPRWRAFGEALVEARPDWETFVLGPVAAYHPGYGEDDVRFFVAIPSVHPTIGDPLVAELADPEYQGHIDVYWGEFFEHVVGKGLPQEAHFDQAIGLLIGIVEEEWLIAVRRDRTGKRTLLGRSLATHGRLSLEIGAKRGDSMAVWSWRGKCEDRWTSVGD